MTARPWTTTEIKLLHELLAEGWKQTLIARRLNRSKQAIHSAVHKARHPEKRDERQARRFALERRRRQIAVDLSVRGLTRSEIAEAMSVSVSTVCTWLAPYDRPRANAANWRMAVPVEPLGRDL